MVGDSGSGGTKGLAPAPAAGDAAAGKYLKADGTWAVPPGSGITQLTGDITAGPGSGSQAATLANTGVVAGSYTSANIPWMRRAASPPPPMVPAGGAAAQTSSSCKATAPAPTAHRDLTTSNKLLCGCSSQDDLSSTTFNFSPTGFVLASNRLNIANGWYAGTGQIIDPTGTDWSGYSLIWLYK